MALIATVWFLKCSAREAREKLENGYDPTEAINKYWAYFGRSDLDE